MYVFILICLFVCLFACLFEGWVFERHPDLGIAMLEYQPGQIIDGVSTSIM